MIRKTAHKSYSDSHTAWARHSIYGFDHFNAFYFCTKLSPFLFFILGARSLAGGRRAYGRSGRGPFSYTFLYVVNIFVHISFVPPPGILMKYDSLLSSYLSVISSYCFTHIWLKTNSKFTIMISFRCYLYKIGTFIRFKHKI